MGRHSRKSSARSITVGCLSMFHPNLEALTNWTLRHRHNKRDVKSLGPDCNSDVKFWNLTKRTFSSLVASVGTAQALITIKKLGCWLARESNATSNALTGLLRDVDSARHATWQSRAAIEFLLLAQGHRCEDFDGLCCRNLSDHSESIPRKHAGIEGAVWRTAAKAGMGSFWPVVLVGKIPFWALG